ncbi:MAG: type I asparaginase [Alistipes sp.]|nr:type I asparaginase [Alistipes sp.]
MNIEFDNERRPRILLIYTGGTIGMRRDGTGTLVPFDFASLDDEFPSVRRLHLDIEVLKLTPIDSSNVTPGRWVELATVIRDNYADFDGFVVLHGTDTMSYTASALSFMLENLAKPVIFTGSQIPMGILRTDGRENLITALEIASSRRADGTPCVPEVALYFQNRLFRGNRTMKQSAEALSAFSSYNYPPLAEVGVEISYNYAAAMRVSGEVEPLRISTDLSGGVVVVKLFPGIGIDILKAILSVPGLKGVVLETYGSGNAPTNGEFIAVLRDAIERGITIVNVTQCVGGTVRMSLYETGVGLQSIGVISGRDMTTEAAVAKLMYVLGGGRSPEEVRRLLEEPIRGEFTA